MTLRKWLFTMALGATVALGTTAVSAADKESKPLAPSALTFGTLRGMPVEEAKGKVEAYLKAAGKFDQAKVDGIWAQNDKTVLDRTVESIALANPAAKAAIDQARDAAAAPSTEVPAAIKTEKDAFAKTNLSAAFAKGLTSKRVYEEALQATKEIVPENLVDPSAFYFFKAVAEHALTKRDDAVLSVIKLLDDVTDSPDRYKMVATLMFFDIQNWSKDPKDLTNIGKLMDNSGRRLDLTRGGTTTQDIQKKIVFRLDEKIKELENKCKGGQCNGGNCPGGGSPGPASGDNPNTPAASSTLPGGGTKDGKVDDKKLRVLAETWGKLPPSERQKAIQEITRDLPAKHKPMIEEYFKSLNRMNGFDK